MAMGSQDASRGAGFADAAAFAADYRRLVLQGPDGEAQARVLAGELRRPA
jgi:hypothetical protein